MFSFLKPPSKLSRIAEEDDDDNDDSFSFRQRMNNQTIGSWKDGFDDYEDYRDANSNIFRVYSSGKEGPIVFCIHGAGATGLSFTLLAKNAKSFCRVYAPDLRGHGHSHVTNENDLSAETLTADCISIIKHIKQKTSRNDNPPIILMGHSMGGGIAVHIANDPEMRNEIKGLIVIDVVEGTAIESLHIMMNVLKKKPQCFYDYQEAIDWSLDSHLLLNRASARISIPDQLIEKDGILVWRTDLFQSQPYWEGWYRNMSQRFLDSPAIKLLFLAGRERLDTPLTIGQMQGKFQMILMNGLGHYLHEDSPEEVARNLRRYLSRYNFLGHLSEEDALKERIKRERAMLYGM